jgi:hypothetical protein
MDSNISKISEVMEDIKQDITDNQYKIIMESLMAINKDPIIYKNHKSNEFIDLLEWLDTKLILSDCCHDFIKRNELYKFVITEYFDNIYYQNIDFVKQVLKIFFMNSTKEQDSNLYFFYVTYRR